MADLGVGVVDDASTVLLSHARAELGLVSLQVRLALSADLRLEPAEFIQHPRPKRDVRAEGVPDLLAGFGESGTVDADEPVELRGEKPGLACDPQRRHPPTGGDCVGRLGDGDELFDPAFVRDGVVVDECDGVAGDVLQRVVATPREADVLLVAVGLQLGQVAEIVDDALVEALVPVDDQNQFDVVVGLGSDALDGFTEVVVDVRGYVQMTTETFITPSFPGRPINIVERRDESQRSRSERSGERSNHRLSLQEFFWGV